MSPLVKTLLCSALLAQDAHGFALIGPYADWMDKSKGYQAPGDIGGPMNIGEGYRWNVPVITYGFERPFLDYFGSNGVMAVEAAIQILNQVPPASQINPQSYPAQAWRLNYVAQAAGLMDLKSTALSLMLEQMGLATPERYTFCIRDFQGDGGSNYWFYVIQRNFDPLTAQYSPYVNDTMFMYYVLQFTPSPTPTNVFCDAVESVVDPFMSFSTTVAGFPPNTGFYPTNLSRDDVGGLRYLLNGSRVRFENLLPDVRAATSNTSLVVGAYRPGIEKITFVRHPTGLLSGEFLQFTNRWTDIYYSGDYPAYQPVERVTTRPDIVFTAQDLGANIVCNRTGTTNWANNSDLNGNWGGPGPGVIQPGVVISLNNTGPMRVNQGPFFLGEDSSILVQAWGSFDGTTNQVIHYPVSQTPFQPTLVQFRLAVGNRTNDFHWLLSGAANGRFLFQTSTNLTSWLTLATITNSGAGFAYEFNAITNETSRFFRTSPVP